ncbi:MAG: sigma-70 family RNA polymerase sigma factor [Eubacterium sp.]|nr:sigma-70 family RNA polymerase sigma factor [Eubacterium sp.]
MMDYAEKTDEELALLSQKGDEGAEEYLLEKFKALVRIRARELFLAGGEQEDLLQEGMLGLFKAIRHYDPDKEASFQTFARLLVSRQIYNAIAVSQRQKNQALNQSVSVDDLDECMRGTAESPENIVLGLENARELRQKIDEALSPLEKEVLEQYLDGVDYLQIASDMKRTPKSIDNALQRIRAKVSRLLWQE